MAGTQRYRSDARSVCLVGCRVSAALPRYVCVRHLGQARQEAILRPRPYGGEAVLLPCQRIALRVRLASAPAVCFGVGFFFGFCFVGVLVFFGFWFFFCFSCV